MTSDNSDSLAKLFDIYKCTDCKDINLTCMLKVPSQEDGSRPFQCPYWINEKPPWRKQLRSKVRERS